MASKSMTDDPYLEKLFGIEACRPEKQKVMLFDRSFNQVYQVSQCGTIAEIKKRSIELSERFHVEKDNPDDSNHSEHG